VTRPVQIAVSGGGADPSAKVLADAEEVGRLLAEADVTVVCGGLGGVMEAVARGASRAGGAVIGIVPSDDRSTANEHCTHVIASGIGHGRNLAVVASGDAVIAIAGEWGTLSEIALARKIGRPVVTLGSWEVRGAGKMEQAPGIESAETPAEAVEAVLRLVRAQAPSG
jgi:uncharacterized protein (TIGR00725 family)